MRRYLKLYGMFISQYIKIIMQSKADFIIGFLAFFLIQASGIAFIYLLFSQIPDLKGWSFYELILIYGFAQIPRGIDHMFMDYIWLLAGHVIVRGEFDKYLLRPMNPLFQLISERFQADGAGEVIIGIILFSIGVKNCDVTLNFVNMMALIIMVLFATLIYTSIKLFFASLAFWIKRSQSILFMFYNTSSFAKYPIEIYHKSIRLFITYIIPFALTAYIPASYFLGKNSLMYCLLMTCGIGTITTVIAYMTWLKGIKAYESVGN
ncbi:ABC transporter permease [Vallitalea okinawensis]|uniref:ABC transporter permease n=1 Tax=Vallitalea okinawensis TaxID=2078660 RepID=UPI000CFB213E|nr:ABC-2 family transporter protein [Vallitalea okinawensis]